MATRRCSLRFGDGVRVFCDPEDRIVLAPGVKPSGVVRVRVNRAELAKVAGRDLPGQLVDLELWFQKFPVRRAVGGTWIEWWEDFSTVPAAELVFEDPDVKLAGWQVLPRVDETLRGVGFETPFNVPRIDEARLYLADPRYQVNLRPRTVSLLANASNADGTAVKDGAPVRSTAEIGEALVAALGLNVVAVDESILDAPAPRDVDWRMADAAAEWSRYEEATGHVLILRTDGACEVRKIAAGGEPALPAGQWELHSESRQSPDDAPSVVVFTSAPNRIVVERTLDMGYFEYVGVDADGSIKPLDELSYRSAEYETWAEAIRDEFDEFDDDGRIRAFMSIGRLLRLRAGFRDMLPLLAERVAVDPADDVRMPAYIAHRGAFAIGDGDTIANASSLQQVHGAQLDGRRGLVIFPAPAWRINDETESSDEYWEEFERFLTGGEFQLICGVESRTGTDEDFFLAAFRRDPGETVGEAVRMDEPAAWVHAEGAAVIRMPHWRPRAVGAVEDVLNATAMEAEAQALAGGLLSFGPSGVRVRAYRGFHRVECGGIVSQVEWDFEACTTLVSVRAWQLPASIAAQQRRLAGGRAGPAGGSADRAAADRAGYAAAMGAGAAAPAAGPMFGVPLSVPTPGGIRGFWAHLTGYAGDGPNRWVYDFVEVAPDGGDHGWAAVSGGRTGTCKNTYERRNAATGLLGVGAVAEGLDTDEFTFSLQPIPDLVPVIVYPVRNADGDREYWIGEPNGIDGGCDE